MGETSISARRRVTATLLKPRAWLLTFGSESSQCANEEIRLDLPEPVLALFEELPHPDYLLDARTLAPITMSRSHDCEIIFLPAGSATPFPMQKAAEGWISEDASGAGARQSVIEVSFQGARVLRAVRKIVIVGDQDWPARKGIAQFEWIYKQLCRLEEGIVSQWQTSEEDATFFYLSRAGRSFQQRAGVSAAQASAAKYWLIRAEALLDRSDLITPPIARRIFLELSLRTEIAARIKAAEKAVDATHLFYEQAFMRLSERREAGRSLSIEICILLAILAEVALYIWELWF
ncbi:hypothetical protein DEV91_1657 [Phyllobacterium brassicacearum]|nr:hypothetical protein DEV91_1657 [Phyllobacterium brassicacearum]